MPGRKARTIAFYLPQFHPIPENNRWWGEGFTEWTNVKKAKQLFNNHYQPRIPVQLGYYDLRDPNVREAQADLARLGGVEGFCYWHYWFGGRQLLETPFNEVLESGKPDFPFCLGWANDSWTGVWHGAPGRTLIEQVYPGMQDERNHFFSLIDAFKDKRYLKVSGKPVFYIYKPKLIPDIKGFISHWNALARQEGFEGIHFIANIEDKNIAVEEEAGFNAVTPHNPGWILYHHLKLTRRPSYVINRLLMDLTARSYKDRFPFLSRPYIYSYRKYIKSAFPKIETALDVYPSIVPNWDNTPRCGVNGVVLTGSTPELFRDHLRAGFEQIKDLPSERRIIFIKSWNEWAEGNYLEPDTKFGYGYLNACRDAVLL